MPKAAPALFVALLTLALVAPASVGGVTLLDQGTTQPMPAPGISENTTRVLRLQTIQAADFGSPDVVVLGALSAQEAELDTAYLRAEVRERLAAAPNSTVQRRILQNFTAAAAVEVRALQRTEREARSAYIADDISAARYAQRLAVIHGRATALARLIGGRAEETPSLFTYASPYGTIQDRIAYLYEELQYLTGPVRAEMAAAVRGERTPVRVFVAAGDSGFELSYLRSDGVYVRSTYRSDNLDTNTSSAGGTNLLVRILPNLYPWASDYGTFSAMPIPPHGTIRTTIFHPHGRIVSYVDETTEQVYYEVQYKRLIAPPTDEDELNTLPVEYAHQTTKNNTSVLVSRTYPGGPLQVKVLNLSGMEPTGRFGVPVTVNETTTRTTNLNGVVWFVSPAGTYNVTTSFDGTEFRFNVTA